MSGDVLRARLESRRAEIEEALLDRIGAISDPAEVSDPTYAEGLRAALQAALDYGLETIERGEERAPPVPLVLLAQARLAARNGVAIDTVLRRYLAGYALLADFLVEEAEGEALRGMALKNLLRTQSVLFEGLLAAVAKEYGRELATRSHSPERQRAERIERLLAGELLDVSSIAYEFEGWHLGLLATGPGASELLRVLAKGIDARPLLVRREEGTVWAWLGARRRVDPEEARGLSFASPAEVSALAIGEPAEGLAGWRLTHRQAKAALRVALRGAEPRVRYADVALLASVLQDELLCASLRRLYLAPLEQERDGGAAMRETLRAYFVAGRNISSAAAELGLSRQAAAKRLRVAEQKLGRPIETCAATLEIALRVKDLDDSGRPGKQAAT